MNPSNVILDVTNLCRDEKSWFDHWKLFNSLTQRIWFKVGLFLSSAILCAVVNKCVWVQRLSVYIRDEEWTIQCTHWNEQHEADTILNFRDGVAKLFDASRPLSVSNWDIFKEMKYKSRDWDKYLQERNIWTSLFLHSYPTVVNMHEDQGQGLAYSGIHVWSEIRRHPSHNTIHQELTLMWEMVVNTSAQWMAERSTQYVSWSTIELLKIVEIYRQKRTVKTVVTPTRHLQQSGW